MAETNKILEVTYGAFSCRLEGFDDSVETMKAVVAYFHEIGGHEKFMDTQPHVPDTARLASIAAAGASGAVTIENTDDGISLRMDDAEVSQDTAEVDAFVETLTADSAVEDDTDDDLTENAFDADGSDAFHATRFEDNVFTSVEDDSDIEAVEETIEDTTFAEEMDVAPELETPEIEDVMAAADDGEADESASDTEEDEARGLPDAASDDLDFVSDDDADDLPELDAPQEEVAETAAPLMLDDPAPFESEASVADKLMRIRAVAGRATTPATQDDTFAEDLSEPEEAPKPANPLAQRLAELAKRNSELMDADDLAEMPQMAPSTPLEVSEEATQDVTPEAEDDAQDDVATSATEAEDAAVVDDIPAMAEEADTPDLAAEAVEEIVEEASVEDEVAEEAAPVIEEAPEVVSEMQLPEPKVAETVPDDADEETTDAAVRPLLLTTRHSSEEDESEDDNDENFDLKAELAEIEREIAARPGNEVARHGLPRSVEDAMSRILNETDQHLNQPESRRHRDAFAQLKAAVAATEASRQLGDLAKSRDISAQFRDDLGALDAEGKAKGASLPPLKLVQPVTEPEEAEAAPEPKVSKPLDAASLRLREIADKAASRDIAEEATFAAFARDQGAVDLADKLEAAAAYIAYVEGDADFSRPQVMKVVQSASDEEISREDGLRSFGRLLRQSRIVKLNNGRFQVAENTRFRPDGDRAAQG